MKEYEDVEIIEIEEDTSFSKYKAEKEREERKKSKSFARIILKTILVFFAILFLAPVVLGSIILVSGLGVAVVVGTVGVTIGAIGALVVSVFLFSGGWMSLGLLSLFVMMGCVSVAGITITLCAWIIRTLWRVCMGKYKAWRYKDVEEVIG
ncbi:MAG: hypothetical protein ACRCTE_02520 [Cellulosilyticaceae bacterium]